MSSERITRADVDRIAATVSEGLPAGVTVEAQGRNGHTALDVYRDDVVMVDNLHIGTAREVYTYLQGMRRAQLLGAREVERCTCGQSLDASGEHAGGYGAFCG